MFNVSNTPHVLDALQSCEIGNRVPLNNFRNNYVIRNINANNYSETILKGHTRGIVTLDVQGSFLATASDDETIKLWNLDTEKCLWTFPLPELNKTWGNSKLKIVKENVIYSSWQGSSHACIQIIDLNTGQETTSIRDSRLMPDRVCMIGRRILAILKKENYRKNKSYVGEWDINGKLQRTFSKIKCDSTPRQRLLLGSENILVHIYYNILKIHDLHSGNDREIKLEHEEDGGQVVKVEIISAYTKNQRLICGCRDEEGIPNCYVIDLKTGKENTYTIKKFSLLIKNFPDNYIYTGTRVEKIILHREWAYLGHSSSQLFAINLEEKKSILLGQHGYRITHLALEEQLLISGSSYPEGNLKFWNIKSLKLVGEIKFSDASPEMAFISGKLLVAVGNSLKTWNYFISSIKKDNKKICENLARK